MLNTAKSNKVVQYFCLIICELSLQKEASNFLVSDDCLLRITVYNSGLLQSYANTRKQFLSDLICFMLKLSVLIGKNTVHCIIFVNYVSDIQVSWIKATKVVMLEGDISSFMVKLS